MLFIEGETLTNGQDVVLESCYGLYFDESLTLVYTNDVFMLFVDETLHSMTPVPEGFHPTSSYLANEHIVVEFYGLQQELWISTKELSAVFYKV